MINLKMNNGDLTVSVECSSDDPEMNVTNVQFLSALNTFLNSVDIYDHCKISITKNLKPYTSVYEPGLVPPNYNYDLNTMGT